MEVMGRHCGYLALDAALASEAVFCFIPEWPPPSNWMGILCRKLNAIGKSTPKHHHRSRRSHRQERNPADLVKTVVKHRLNYNIRVLFLITFSAEELPQLSIACKLSNGRRGLLALMEMNEESEKCVISIDGNSTVRVPLLQYVERTQQVKNAMDDNNRELAVRLRGRSFHRNLELRTVEKDNLSVGQHFNVAVMNGREPAGGLWNFTLYCAYQSTLILLRNRDVCHPVYPQQQRAWHITFSLDSTRQNEICTMNDQIKQSATGTKKRMFIIETMGGFCRFCTYLATLSALTSEADIYEMERINVLGHAEQGGSPTPFDCNMGLTTVHHRSCDVTAGNVAVPFRTVKTVLTVRKNTTDRCDNTAAKFDCSAIHASVM